MLTKKELCQVILERNPDTTIFQSSCVAVASAYLGLLTEDEKSYASQRGGILFSHENGKCLTLREVLELLPE